MMVKICGITCQEDARAAAEFGARAIGFNFYRPSPRYLEPERAGGIETPAGLLRAGIFVDPEPGAIESVAALARLDVAQVYGRLAGPVRLEVWRAYRVTPGWTLPSDEADAILLDSPAPGSGQSFDWSAAAQVRARLILAGGLDAENVRIAIEAVRPWGVDACSRLESSPGKKDHAKMARFIRAALQT